MELQYYLKLLEILEVYFGESKYKKLFMEGGCFWLASYLKERIPGAKLWINRNEEHCALYFDDALYDVRGKIPKTNFHEASEREISFMRKNYVPKFDVKKLENYLDFL